MTIWAAPSDRHRHRGPEQRSAAKRYRRAAAIVDGSGAARLVEQRLGPSRPDVVPARTLLIGLLMAVLDGRAWFVSEATAQLELLPGDLWYDAGAVRERRGYDRDDVPPDALVFRSYRAMARRLVAVARAYEVSPNATRPDGTPYSDDELAESEQALAELTHAVLAVTLPPDVDLGTLTVDGTGLEAWVRRRTRRDALAGSSDPDCDWRVRDKDGERQSLLGYSLQAVTARDDRGRPFCVGVDLRSGNTPERAHGRGLLDRIVAHHPRAVRRIVADKGYTDALDEWHTYWRAQGILTVYDPKQHQQGTHSTAPGSGALAANGNAYCPSTPLGLLEPDPEPKVKADDPDSAARHDAWRQRQHERARYLLGAHTRQAGDGSFRARCCADRADGPNCALRAWFHPDTFTPSRPSVLDPPSPDKAPNVCTQKTVLIPGIVNKQPMARDLFGSDDWHRSYGTPRSAVEGWFGQLKTNPTFAFGKGRLRLRGRTRWTLIVALVAAALNDSHNHAGTDEHRSYRKARWVVRDAWQPAMFDHDPAPARAGPDIAA